MSRGLLRAAAVASLVAVSALALALTGCGSATSSSAVQPAQATSRPTIKLVAPAAGSAVPAGDVTVTVTTTGLKFVMPSNTKVPGEGHLHVTLDDQTFKMSTKPEYTLEGVTAGPHKLKAELVQNDTKSFDPPVEEEIEFTVQ